MKKIPAVIVLCCLLAQCMLQLGVLGYYELNKTYIAAHLCENRDKPELKCCGKCYLRKQLKKAGDVDGSRKMPSKTEKNELIVFVLPQPAIVGTAQFCFTQQPTQHPVLQDMHDVAALSSVFHPPGIAC